MEAGSSSKKENDGIKDENVLIPSVLREAVVLYSFLKEFKRISDEYGNLRAYIDGLNAKGAGAAECEILWWQRWVKTVSHAINLILTFSASKRPNKEIRKEMLIMEIAGSPTVIDDDLTKKSFELANDELLEYTWSVMKSGKRYKDVNKLTPMQLAVHVAVRVVQSASVAHFNRVEQALAGAFSLDSSASSKSKAGPSRTGSSRRR